MTPNYQKNQLKLGSRNLTLSSKGLQIRSALHRCQQLIVLRTAAYVLIPALVSLVKPDRVESWLRPHISRALSFLPLRPRGVRSTIEFVLSVHPTTAATAETQGREAASKGPQISPEALTSATQLVCSPPQGVTPYYWFEHLAPQLFSLLDGNGGLDMVKVAAYIIGYGILGRPQYGAPPGK